MISGTARAVFKQCETITILDANLTVGEIIICLKFSEKSGLDISRDCVLDCLFACCRHLPFLHSIHLELSTNTILDST
jgi:hypothetical protein